MGSGKTSVGPHLSSCLKWPFLDLDIEIEKKIGCTIREVFEKEGEAYFRRQETATLQDVSHRESSVIALGGGAFIQPENREWIRGWGVSVFLDCPWEIVMERCSGDTTRPLFQDIGKAKELYDRRRATYQLCDIIVPVDQHPPEGVAEKILEQLQQRSRQGEVTEG